MEKVKIETEVDILWGKNRKLLDLDCADDILFICDGPEEIQSVLNYLVSEGQEVGLVINSRKTEIMNISIENAQDCMAEVTTIKQDDKFRYLGTYLAKDRSLRLEFDERLKKIHQAMGILKNIWNNNNFT